MSDAHTYKSAAEALSFRILAAIPAHPEILTMDGPWPLLKMSDFDCADLEPTMAQAQWALGRARYLWAGGRHERT